MAPSQQSISVPECQELRDERAPRRLRALRALVIVSALGWLSFAALIAVTSAEAVPADGAGTLVLGESVTQPAVGAAAPDEAPLLLAVRESDHR